jgi:hypothetical protein
MTNEIANDDQVTLKRKDFVLVAGQQKEERRTSGKDARNDTMSQAQKLREKSDNGRERKEMKVEKEA